MSAIYKRRQGSVTVAVAAAAYVCNEIVVVGELIGYVKDDIAIGKRFELHTEGHVVCVAVQTAATEFADGVGQKVYWDAENEVVTNDTGIYIGTVARVGGGTGVEVDFCPDPSQLQYPADPGDAGAVPVVNDNAHVEIVTAGAETRTVADAVRAGQVLCLNLKTDGGDCVVTAASAINATGNNTITLDDAGDGITLKSVAVGAAFKWRVLGNHGAGLSTV